MPARLLECTRPEAVHSARGTPSAILRAPHIPCPQRELHPMKRIVLGILVSSMLLGACTAHEKSGDRAAAVGDWKSAYMSYRAALGDEPTPELQKKFAEARDHAMADTQKRAQACAQVNDWNCALQEADFALQIDGGNAELASFRANAANQVALSHLEAADSASARGQ